MVSVATHVRNNFGSGIKCHLATQTNFALPDVSGVLAPPHLQATTVGEVDPSFCPALALSNSDRTAPDLGMVAALQSSRWMRVTTRGDRSLGGRGGGS